MKKINKTNFLYIVAILLITALFFWKTILKGYLPFPGDLMIGAYFPWLEYKWGNVVGVAVKNPLISDVFSQIYIWKKMVGSSLKIGVWPLWNPMSYSGIPLLANFQSGVFNPLNIFSVLFGSRIGWSLMMIGQVLGSCLAMYFFLKSIKISKISALIGAITYGFSGFSIAWLEFATIGQAMIWIPFILLAIEKAAQNKCYKFLYWIPLLFLFIVGAGHFQALLFSAILCCSYLIFRLRLFSKEGKMFVVPTVFCAVLSLTMSMVQLLPTIELMNRSVRFEENYIDRMNYGLIPVANIITIFAPDVFGNVTTVNYWGVINYQETVIYAGVLGALALLFSISYQKKNFYAKFFLITAIISLLMVLDTPVGKLIYYFNVPGLSTSAAGRAGMIFVFSLAVLTGLMVENIEKLTVRERVKWPVISIAMLILIGVILFWAHNLFKTNEVSQYLGAWITNTKVGLRNIIIPIGLLMSTVAIFYLTNKIKKWKYLLLLVVLADLFRFGWKYLPFVPKTYVFPETEITNYLLRDKSVFRVEKEQGELLPPNTWAAYDLQSPSGYDPMAITDYVKSFQIDLNKEKNPGVSRYSEIQYYDAEALGKYNVKYLLAIKRDNTARIPGDTISYKINENEWVRVFQTPAVAILLNTKFKERVRIIDRNGNDASGSAKITSYQNNKVVISLMNTDGQKLLFSDTYYPGWVATINGLQTKIGDEIKPFRTVDIRGIKEGEVIFEYKPDSFRIGLIVSIISLGIWIIMMLLHEKK